MTVPLSTSSSESHKDFFADKPWAMALMGGLFIISVIIGFFEYNLRARHWTPTVNDTVELWIKQRQQASQLGDQALILIGGSRIQLGTDLNLLEKLSGKKPIQLAIDGSNFYPVLKNLAEDPTITGNIILDLHESLIENLFVQDKAWDWVNAYQQQAQQPLYKQLDQTIHNYLTQHMVTKLEGAKPSKVIAQLALQPKQGAGNYLITHNNRSRDADYSKVKMPDFYIARVIRHSGLTLDQTQVQSYSELLALYENAITKIPVSDDSDFNQNLPELIHLINQLKTRGSKVFIVRMPTSKLIWAIDQQRYPLEKFWQQIATQHAASIHFKDYSELNSFDLPDGSHLDQKDKAAFTEGLYQTISSLNL